MSGPSGEQYALSFGAQAAVVTEVGAGLRTYSVGERQILDGYGPDEICPSGRGQVLMPWPNRIADGSYAFAGRPHQLPINERGTGSAIHGLVRWAGWRLEDRGERSVSLQHDLYPQPGYPYALDLRLEYSLSDDGLRVATRATNVGDVSCPFGAGAHPYLRVAAPTIDTATLVCPARRVLAKDGQGSARWTDVEGTRFDFVQARQIGDVELDDCFTDLARDDDGVARVVLTSTDEGGIGIVLWTDESYPYLMLYSGDGRPDVARRSLAVEPMTCPPDAFRTGEGVVVLEPGGTFEGAWGIALS